MCAMYICHEERLYYTAPELNAQGISYKHSNIYSLSYMIYQILTGRNLFRKNFSEHILYKKIANGLRPDTSCIQNDDIIDFLRRCWNSNIAERLTIDEVIEFITSPTFCSYFNSDFDSLDHESIKNYLDIYGDEFNNFKDKF